MATAAWQIGLLIAGIVFVIFDIIVLVLFTMWFIRKRRESNEDTVFVKHKSQPTYDFKERLLSTQSASSQDDVTDFQIPTLPAAGLLGEHMSLRRTKSFTRDIQPKEFDSSLYSRKLSVEQVTAAESNLPSLRCRFYYYNESEELIVALTELKNLPDIGSDMIFTSVVIPGSLTVENTEKKTSKDLVYNHEFRFPVFSNELRKTRVRFNVWKADKYAKRSALGYMEIGLGEFTLDNGQFPGDGTGDIWRPLVLSESDLHAQGRLLISLCYLPSAQRINVAIVKGDDLPFVDVEKAVYAKCTAYHLDKVLKIRKTSTIKKSPTPNFHEEVGFTLGPSDSVRVEDISLKISVNALRISLPRKRLLGNIILGKTDSAPQLSQTHWRDMLNNQRETISVWHPLTL